MRLRSSRAARRTCLGQARLFEALESRQLLSAVLPGTAFSSARTYAGQSDLLVDNVPGNLQTRISLFFNRQTDAGGSSPKDLWNLSVDVFQRDTHASLGHLGSFGNGVTGPFTVTSDSTNVLHLIGTFAVDGAAFGATQHASLSVDIAFSRLVVAQTIDSMSLAVALDGRLLTQGQHEDGTAAATATLNWLQASPEVQATFPSPTTVGSTTGHYITESSNTNSLSPSLSLDSLIKQLSPPSQTPKNTQVSARSVQSATAPLTLAGVADPGGIRLSMGDQYFTNAGTLPASAYLNYTLIDGSIIGGNLTTGLAFASDGSSASAVGNAVGQKVTGSVTTNVPFSLDVHWQAARGDVSLAFYRTITTTADTITTAYTQVTERGAVVTGSLSLAVLPPLPTLDGTGLLTVSTDVTLVMPTAKKAAGFVPTDVSKTDWQNIVVNSWKTAVQTGTDAGLFASGGTKPSHAIKLVVAAIVKILPFVKNLICGWARLPA